jgi:hypothetical protein
MSLDGSYDMILLPPPCDNDNGGQQPARRRRNRRHLPRVAEEQHSSSPRPLPRRWRRRRGNQAQAGGSASSAVERVDGASAPTGGASGVNLAFEMKTSAVSPQHANSEQTDDASMLPKAGVPLGTSRRDFPIHGGSLGPHQAHAQHSACGPRVTSTTSTITATVGPTSTRGCAEATTPGVGYATTAGRIGVPRPNHLVRRLSAAPYDGRRSRPGSDPRLLSQSTRGRRDRNCGSRTTGWPANWVERTMTTSSSATSPCSSPIPLAPGWSTCSRGRSPTGTT